MYGLKSNIASMIDILEKMFKLPGIEGHIKTVYASLRGHIEQKDFKFISPTVDIAEQNWYHEELFVSLFLDSVPTSINIEICDSILRGTTLLIGSMSSCV